MIVLDYFENKYMASGEWCLIESDPGVFTDLIHGFGIKNVLLDKFYVYFI
jgi:hypothetical protein